MMTEKRYTYSELNNCQYSVDYTTFKEIYGEENIFHSRICEVNNKKQAQKVVNLLNKEEETIQNQNQEITACYDTLTTIIELCTAVLNYDFKNVNNKVDFCHMLNEMDNKDLAFLKECFEAIRNSDLKEMTSLIMEIKRAKEYKEK